LKGPGVEDKDVAYIYRSSFEDKGEELFDVEQIPGDWVDE